jgi:hypothetical protein
VFLAPFCIGLVWGMIYRTWPNSGAPLSHAALGPISIAIGLV